MSILEIAEAFAKGPIKPAVVRFWVELLNPTSRPYTGGATGPLGDGTAHLIAPNGGWNVYQLQVARQRKVPLTRVTELWDPSPDSPPGRLVFLPAD